jgi:hypothetical protein
MRAGTIFILLQLFNKLSFGQSTGSNVKAKILIETSINAMGGGWTTVNSLSLAGYGYTNDVDQSERPEGPYIHAQFSRDILKDIKHGMFQLHQTTKRYDYTDESTYLFNERATALKKGGTLSPTLQAQQLYDELYLSPELILRKALAALDLAFVKDTVYQAAQHSIIAFKFEGYPVRMFLNKETDLLTAVEITKPYKNEFFSVLGDGKKTVIYSFWMLLGKGLHYPLQQDVFINKWYKGSYIINKWEVNPAVNPDSLKIPEKIAEQGKTIESSQQQKYKKLIEQGGKEIKPGVWFFRGICNSAIIEQEDGIVVIEGPYASFYGEAIAEKARTLFPEKKIKALITTSDAWLHIGGIRAFAAIPGIKIYHPARNKFIVNEILNASYHTEPDAFALQSIHSYKLVAITDTMVIGSGKNRLIAYTFKTESADRMMMVYFPEQKMLYMSDLYQPKDPVGKYWDPQMAWEAYHSIQVRKLVVEQLYSMHSPGLVSFTEFTNDFKNGLD